MGVKVRQDRKRGIKKKIIYIFIILLLRRPTAWRQCNAKRAGFGDGVVVVYGVDDDDGEVEDCSWQLFEKRKVVGTNLLPTLFLKM